MTLLLGRQGELLAQLRELLTMPSSPPANKLESAVGPLAGGAGPGPPPPPAAAPSSMADDDGVSLSSCGGRRRWQRGRWSSRRGRDDEVTNVEHHGDPAAAGAARPRRHYCKRRRKKEQSGTSMVVTSAPDLFDGYQWRKYGQKLIEGAMYPRSYYRCTRSAEQGCAAKRTVQRNDDADNGGAAAAAPKYTVVRVGEHTCTANDSLEAPVILETTAVVPAASCTSNNSTAPTSSSAAAVASCSTTTAATESPVISDNTLSSSSIASSECYCYVDDDGHGLLAAAVHDNDWVPALAASSPSSLPTIEAFAGPIRSPVHISAADVWTIDHQFLLQLVNEPTISASLKSEYFSY